MKNRIRLSTNWAKQQAVACERERWVEFSIWLGDCMTGSAPPPQDFHVFLLRSDHFQARERKHAPLLTQNFQELAWKSWNYEKYYFNHFKKTIIWTW